MVTSYFHHNQSQRASRPKLQERFGLNSWRYILKRFPSRQYFILKYWITWLLFILFQCQIEKMCFFAVATVWLNTWVIPLGGSSPEITPANYFMPGYLAVSQGHSEKAWNEQVIPWLSELQAANPDWTWRLTDGMGLLSYPGLWRVSTDWAEHECTCH